MGMGHKREALWFSLREVRWHLKIIKRNFSLSCRQKIFHSISLSLFLIGRTPLKTPLSLFDTNTSVSRSPSLSLFDANISHSYFSLFLASKIHFFLPLSFCSFSEETSFPSLSDVNTFQLSLSIANTSLAHSFHHKHVDGSLSPSKRTSSKDSLRINNKREG